MILAVGEALVEIMRPERGLPLDRPGPLAGPYASGAPAIFASVAARLGAATALCAVVGEDPFGALLRRRLSADGVDVGALHVAAAAPTACAFVAYQPDGSRSFVFHVAGAAAGLLGREHLGDLPERATWMHVSGSTLALSERMAATVEAAVVRVAATGGRVSVDPNVRPEALTPRLGERLRRLAQSAYVLMPSEGELEALGLDERSVTAPVVCTTLGERGARVRTASGVEDIPAPAADEVDPTGAGDTFAAAFAVATLAGAEPAEAGRAAVTVAAGAVEYLGPMEAPVTAGAGR